MHNSQHSCVVQVLFMCGFDKHLLAARLVPLPRHGNFTKKITYTSDFFIIIRYLLSTQSMISRLYLGKYKANAKKYTYLLKKGKQNKVKNHLLPISPQSDQTVTSEVPIKNIWINLENQGQYLQVQNGPWANLEWKWSKPRENPKKSLNEQIGSSRQQVGPE